MKKILSLFSGLIFLATASNVLADDYQEAIDVFKNAGESGTYFDNSYGYALFPSVTKAGVIAGGAHGKGRVYQKEQHVGNTELTQISAGLQLGVQVYSQIIFFKDEDAFNEFTSGNFEFGGQASAVVVNLGTSFTATSDGAAAGASGGRHHAKTTSSYKKGKAVFIVAKGGLMLEASLGGQNFTYTPM